MYYLKPEMAEELKETKSEIYRESPNFLNETNFIATIGDICTIKIIEQIRIPNLMIVDLKTKRDIKLNKSQLETIRNIKCKEVQINNKAGTISKELYHEIQKALNSDEKTKIIIDGEEDLAALPVIKLCKNGAKVIYGMPDRGMVVVDVNQQAKERANKILERMLVK